MPISPHFVSNVEKQYVKIITVDPSTQRIEVLGKDAAITQVAVGEPGAAFQWPLVGEVWTISRENGYWRLGGRVPHPDDPVRITDLEPGESMLDYRPITPLSYTVATLPEANSVRRGTITFVQDAPAGSKWQASDGSTWVILDIPKPSAGSIGPVTPAFTTITTNQTFDFTNNQYDVLIRFRLGASGLVINLTNVPLGAQARLRIDQHGTTAFTMPTIQVDGGTVPVRWAGGTVHVMSTALDAIDRILGERSATGMDFHTVGKGYA